MVIKPGKVGKYNWIEYGIWICKIFGRVCLQFMGNLQTQIHDKPLPEIGGNWFEYETKLEHILAASIPSRSQFQVSLDSLVQQVQVPLVGKGKPRCVPYLGNPRSSNFESRSTFFQDQNTQPLPQRHTSSEQVEMDKFITIFSSDFTIF